MSSTLFVLLFSLLPLTSLAAPQNCTLFEKSVRAGSAPARLQSFLKAQWTYRMTEYPTWATFTGYPGQDDRFTDLSADAIARRREETQCQLKSLQKISRNSLSGEDKVTFDLALRDLREAIEGFQFDSDFLVLDQMSGPQIDIADLLQAMPRASVKDYENRLARLEKLPKLEDQIEGLLREGLKRKVTPVKMFLQKVPGQIEALLTPKVIDSPLYSSFKDIGTEISEADRDRVQKAAQDLIQKSAYPAFEKLRNFLTREYIPQAREETSFSTLPKGPEWYAYLVKMHTTTSMTPDQLHEFGLQEVERIGKEMQKVRDQVGFKKNIKAFHQFLLKDPQFYFEKPQVLMLAYRDLAKRIDPELPRLFGKLPRLTYGVREMAAYKAPAAPTAYYMPGAPDAGRAGIFEANTYDLKARPKWGMEALTLHEAVPGHHLQISLAQEIEGLPEFRKNGGYTAFVEGWALYAESLGEDLGFYQDPYSKYGELTYEMWRAVRLVVDTGMHAKGWSREKALNYFMDLLPKSQLESEVEIDRYITWPGQALAYKVGQTKFREMRAKAKAELGEKFNIREYHDEVLRHGALPMDVLEKLFNEWLEAKKKSKK